MTSEDFWLVYWRDNLRLGTSSVSGKPNVAMTVITTVLLEKGGFCMTELHGGRTVICRVFTVLTITFRGRELGWGQSWEREPSFSLCLFLNFIQKQQFKSWNVKAGQGLREFSVSPSVGEKEAEMQRSRATCLGSHRQHSCRPGSQPAVTPFSRPHCLH